MTRERRRLIGGLAVAAASAAVLAPGTALAQGEIVLVSRASGKAGVKGNGPSQRPAISANGRFVVFESRATNLHPDDTDRHSDVYVRDLLLNRTTLVSRADGPNGQKGNSDSGDASISADGRRVAFASTASNLGPGTFSTTAVHVYVRDLATSETMRVDRASGSPGLPANDESGHPAISANGRFVSFDTAASNLDPADTNDRVDVYLRDLATETTSLVSHRTPDVAEDDLALSALSADARRVTYRTFALLGEGDDAELLPGRAFTRDMAVGPTASFSSAYNVLGHPAISNDGRKVVLITRSAETAPRGDRARVWLPGTGRKITASRGLDSWGRFEPGSSNDPSFSPSGRHVVFSVQHGNRRDGFRAGAVIRDLPKRRSINVLGAVSRRSTDRPPFAPLLPTLSHRARRLAFQSQARRLVPDDRDARIDIFVVEDPARRR